MSNDVLCNSYEDEWELCTVIRRRQCKPDKDSKTLTESLLLEFANKPPFHLSYTTTSRLSRHFIGDDLADELGLERSSMLSRTMTVLSYCFLRTLSLLQRWISPLERGMYAFGRYSLNVLLELSLKGKKPSYIMKVYS